MFIRFPMPNYAPDTGGDGGEEAVVEQGTESGAEGGTEPAEPAEQPDGPGSGRNAIRKSLEKGFQDANKAAEKVAKPAKGKGATFDKVRERQGADDVEPAEGTEPVEPKVAEAPKIAVPAGMPAELVEDWGKTPPAVQAAITKRIEDMNNGVRQLQGKYADIDAALAPHLDAVRSHGHTPAQAVSQLFGWFNALARNPGAAFPALAKSFNYDWDKIRAIQLAGQQQQAAQQPGTEGQPQGEIPPALQQYIDGLKQELTAYLQEKPATF